MTVDDMINHLYSLREKGYGNSPMIHDGLSITKVAETVEGSGVFNVSCGLPKLDTKEIYNMNHQSSPVLPVTIDAYGHRGHDDHDGLEGKDASFLTGLHLKNAIHDNGRENIIQSL